MLGVEAAIESVQHACRFMTARHSKHSKASSKAERARRYNMSPGSGGCIGNAVFTLAQVQTRSRLKESLLSSLYLLLTCTLPCPVGRYEGADVVSKLRQRAHAAHEFAAQVRRSILAVVQHSNPKVPYAFNIDTTTPAITSCGC